MDSMTLTFLGTASAYPTPSRCVSCTALSHDLGVWLFDCGEGAQVQLMKSSLKPGKISKIFITHLHGDHSFGLPGLLCTMGQTGQREEPVEIYGPKGIRHYVCTFLALSRADLVYNFIIHEFETIPEQLPENQAEWPIEAPSEVPFHPNELKGTSIQPDKDLIWDLYSSDKLTVKAVWVKHRIPSFAFIVQESKKPGKLNIAKLKSMGVPPGPIYARIKGGESITLENGTTINPADVLGPAIPGRLLVVGGDSCDSSQLTKLAHNASVMVHEATLENSLWEQCVKNGHSTPEMTATLARELNVKMLILTHVSQRYKPMSAEVKDGEKSAGVLLEEAQLVMPPERVMLAEDFVVFNIPQDRPS